jgi:zinc protease
LAILKREVSASLEKQLNDPQPLALRAVRRALGPYEQDDPRYNPTVTEEIERVKAVSRDDIKKLHEKFLGAQGELAITGDFDVDQTVAALTKILADWKPAQPFAELHRSGDVKLARKIDTINTPEKANATFAAGTVFAMRDDDSDYPLLVMADFILGGGTLSSRLGNRVRQKEGLSYGVRSGLTASSIDKRTAFSIFAICNPANMERLKQVIDEEVSRLLKDGVTQDELENAKKGYLQGQEVARSDDASLAKMMCDNLRAGRTMKYYADLEKKIAAATPAQVGEAFRKHVDPKRLVIVEAGDFKSKPAEAKAPKAADAPK